MSQTTLKIDPDVLADLQALAASARRTPQRQLRYLLDCEKARLRANADHADCADPEAYARVEIVKQTEASAALEGYAPLSETGGYAYELQQQWIRGEITSKERIALLKEYRGLK